MRTQGRWETVCTVSTWPGCRLRLVGSFEATGWSNWPGIEQASGVPAPRPRPGNTLGLSDYPRRRRRPARPGGAPAPQGGVPVDARPLCRHGGDHGPAGRPAAVAGLRRRPGVSPWATPIRSPRPPPGIGPRRPCAPSGRSRGTRAGPRPTPWPPWSAAGWSRTTTGRCPCRNSTGSSRAATSACAVEPVAVAL